MIGEIALGFVIYGIGILSGKCIKGARVDERANLLEKLLTAAGYEKYCSLDEGPYYRRRTNDSVMDLVGAVHELRGRIICWYEGK